MAEKILHIAAAAAGKSGGVAVIFATIAAIIIFVVAVILCFCVRGLTISARLRFAAGILCCLCLAAAACILDGTAWRLFGGGAAVMAALAVALFLQPTKRVKVTREQRDFARFLDKKASVETLKQEEDDVVRHDKESRESLVGEFRGEARCGEPCGGIKEGLKKTENQPPKGTVYGAGEEGAHTDGGTNVFNELDVSHVENVISRLDYFGLSQGDRKQVVDLECALSQARRGTDDPLLKERINDGLSSLLKIMSKYGC